MRKVSVTQWRALLDANVDHSCCTTHRVPSAIHLLLQILQHLLPPNVFMSSVKVWCQGDKK